MKKKKLWTRNFTLVVLGTIISAMGGIGLNTAMGVMVFEETQSTGLAGLFTALALVPQVVLPLVIGPLIDRKNPLKLLLKNEIILAIVFFIAAGVAYFIGFHYIFFMLFSILISSLGILSHLASSSIHPQVMERENYVKGNAVLNVIYPLCSIVVAPVAIFLFDHFGIPLILFLYGVATIIDVLIESRINATFEYKESEKFGLKEFKNDVVEGFAYFLKDPAIRSVFIFFTFVMFADAANTLIYPFFNQNPTLTNANYAFLKSVQSAGYLIGGFLQYFVKIKEKGRYALAVALYFLFVLIDSTLFFLPFSIMCVGLFVLGVAGSNSANIRVSAVAAHVPNLYRAKINALFTVMVSAAQFIGQLLAGALGEILDFSLIRVGFQMIYLAGIILFILPKRNKVKELYNYGQTN